MACRLMWQNHVDSSATVITAGSANADLPVANVQHPHRTKVYRTGASVAAEWVKFDFGSAKAVQAVILLDHTLTAGDTLIKVQGNASDSWGSPSVDQSLTFNAGSLRYFFGSEQSYRWWRVIFTKSAAGETRDVGRIFLGPLYESVRNIKFGSLKITPVDLSETDRSLGGQTYSEIKDIYHEVKGELGFVGDAQMTQLKSLADSCGTHTPFFVSLDDTNKPYDWLYYVKAKRLAAREVEILKSGSYLWSTSLELAEEL